MKNIHTNGNFFTMARLTLIRKGAFRLLAFCCLIFSTTFDVQAQDTDGDGIANATDADADNDGIPDALEEVFLLPDYQPPCGDAAAPDFSGEATLISGTDEQAGAVYRIENVMPGTDALVEIEERQNIDEIDFDDNNLQNPAAFQPITRATSALQANEEAYTQYRFTFVSSGTETPVTIPYMFANISDIDGTAASGDFHAFADHSSYIVEDGNNIEVINSEYDNEVDWTKVLPETNEVGGTDTLDKSVAITAKFTNFSTFRLRLGTVAWQDAQHGTYYRDYRVEFSCPLNYSNPVTSVVDFDEDGLRNTVDPDSDNDGIPDVIEAGGADPDNNGQIGSGTGTGISDANSNGLATDVDPEEGGTELTPGNSDDDPNPDYLDTDSDGDGINDLIEGRPTADFVALTGQDADNDGIDNAFDDLSGFGSTAFATPVDTDTDTTPDYLDTDSDDDGQEDSVEGYDTDNDGNADTEPSGTDQDRDGLDDAYDQNDLLVVSDNGQTPESFPNDDNTSTSERDWRQPYIFIPVANPDSLSVDEDNALVLEDIFLNDLESDDGPAEDSPFTITESPETGTLSSGEDGTYTYTPPEDFNGEDSFIYQICDIDGDCDTALVVITVNPVNDLPVVDNEELETDEDTPGTGNLIGEGDSDPEGTELSASTTPLIAPSNGTIEIQADGEFTYTPDENFNGADTVVVEVCDNGDPLPSACVPDTIFITVNPVSDPPVLDNEVLVIDEDTEGNGVIIDEGDTDPDGTELTVSEDLLMGPANGSVDIDASGEFTYIPAPDFYGNDTIVAEVCDAGLPEPGQCSSDTLFITVNPVNDPPIAENDTTATNPGVEVTVDAGANDSDVDQDDELTYTVQSHPDGTTASIDAVTGILTYTPTGSGTPRQDIIIYQVCDNGDPQHCIDASIVVEVPSDPVPPVAADDEAETDEDTDMDVDVIANDTDPNVNLDSSSISIHTEPLHGTAGVGEEGTGIISYSPEANFNGTDSLVYTICDNTGLCSEATLVITINPVNDAPTAAADYTAADPAESIIYNVGDNDSDVDEETEFTFTLISAPEATTAELDSETGELSYTPTSDSNPRQDTVRYSVCDDGTPQYCDETIVLITVPDAPLPPVATDDDLEVDEDTHGTVNVLMNDRDVNGDLDSNSVQVTSEPENGAVSPGTATGELTYTPAQDYVGQDTFTYTICDEEGECSDAEVVITVNPVNDAPVAVDDSTAVNPATTVTVDVSTNDSDVDEGTILTYTLDSNPEGTSADMSTEGILTYTPSDSETDRRDTVTYLVCDGENPSLCDTGTVLITVPFPDTAPVASDDVVETDEDSPASFDVTANDSDINSDLDVTSVSVITLPQNGNATAESTGEVSYIPAENYNGMDSLEYEVCDITSRCDSAWVHVTVNAVNDPPLTANQSVSTDEDNELNGNVITSEDTDVEGTTLTAEETVQTPSHGSLQIDSDGSYRYMPDENYNGYDTIIIQVCDNGLPEPGACTNDTTFITVNPVNDVPVADDVEANADPGIATDILLGESVSDPDEGTEFTYHITSTPQGATASVDPETGVLTYTAADNDDIRTDVVEYEVCDNAIPAQCATGEVHIAVPDRTFNPKDDFVTITEDSSALVSVLVNDTAFHSVDINTLRITEGPENGTATVINGEGNIEYVPDADYYGNDTITYSICKPDPSGECKAADLIVSISPVNDLYVYNDYVDVKVGLPPVDGNFIMNNDDPEGTEMTAEQVVLEPVNGSFTMTVNGDFTYTPDENAPSGEDIAVVQVCDNGEPAPGKCINDTIYFTLEQNMFISEGFTPNGDNINEYFIIETAIPGAIQVKMYNRWGSLVYENSDYQNDWNGKANTGMKLGESLPSGTYFYEIIFGNGDTRRNYITIVR